MVTGHRDFDKQPVAFMPVPISQKYAVAAANLSGVSNMTDYQQEQMYSGKLYL